MKIFRIKKKNGKTRTIYAPNAEDKARFRKLLPDIANAAMVKDVHNVQHGFFKGRSPVTNARAHIGWRYSLCFDLEDFFDHVTREKLPLALTVLASWPNEKLDACYWKGVARQGLPTSPALANLTCSRMDAEIVKMQTNGRFRNFVYTRYADDLSFSFDAPDIEAMLKREVPRIVASYGFKINESKTHLQCATAGRRIITGVGVGSFGIHPTREAKRKLRAARHQGKPSRIRGQEEWIKLKLPKLARLGESTTVTIQTNAILRVGGHSAHHAGPPVGTLTYTRKLA